MTLSSKISRIFGRRSGRSSEADEASDETGLHYFLLVYDPGEQALVQLQRFEDFGLAEAAYSDTEAERRGTPSKVLLFTADSVETIARTHPHYFEDELAEDAEPFKDGVQLLNPAFRP